MVLSVLAVVVVVVVEVFVVAFAFGELRELWLPVVVVVGSGGNISLVRTGLFCFSFADFPPAAEAV